MSRNKTKLLIIVKSIDGGTGTYVLQLLKLKKLIKNLQIRVICLESPSFRKNYKYSNKFIFYHDKNFYPQLYKFSFKNILNIIQDLFWVKNQVNKFTPDVIISVDFHCNLLTIINKLIFFPKVKIVGTTHINLIDTLIAKSTNLTYKTLKRLIPFFYNRFDVLISTSCSLANNLKKEFHIGKKMITIYHGIDKIINGEKLFPISGTILSNGRLVEQKDFVVLIKAFYLVNKKIPKTKLWIIGDGPMKNRLMNYALRLNLKDKIEFIGWVSDIYAYLKKVDVLILSSKREGFSYALIEAMSCGLPVISTDTPFGPREILDNGKYGILVPMKDPQTMADAMYELLTNEKKYNYYAQKSLERVNYFSLDKMLNAYKKVILDVINKP